MSETQKTASKDPCAQPRPGIDATLEARVPPTIKAHLETLRGQEAKILAGLNKDPKRAVAFLSDPAKELKRLGIKVPDGLRAALKPPQGIQELFAAKPLRLANGQIVTPKVKLTISGGR